MRRSVRALWSAGPRSAAGLALAMALAACGSDREGRPASTAQPIVGGLADPMIATAGQVVNRYTSLATDAAAGATSIAVADATALGATAGDLLLVVQMQGARIDGTDTSAFGTVTSLGGAGAFEMTTIAGVAGNTITLAAGCGLRNAYAAAARTQVVWVPQYASLTVAAAGSITAPAWNGTTGGVVAVQAGALSLAGAIDVSGKGFRGGALSNFAAAPPTTTFDYRSTDATAGGEKGEGIAGFEADYDTTAIGGRYSLGAAANAGGGGAAHNGGGGGGANGDDGRAWSGAGVMPADVTGAIAWSLDAVDVDAGGPSQSSGGGRGGYSYSANAEDPTVVAPGTASWGGDDRQYRGGLGGRPVTDDPTATLFAGGGGGAGNENNDSGGAGGAGGGIVIVVADSVTGSGAIRADGAAGQSTPVGNMLGRDGPGGGGAGGSIVLAAPSTGALTLSAAGGAGGDQNIEGEGNEAEGPGGGGGGGFIAAASLTGAALGGGAGGLTNSPAMAKFPRNGATDGAPGSAVALASGVGPPVCIAADLAIAMSDGGGTVTAGTNVTYTIVVTNQGPNPVAGATVDDTLGAAFSGDSWTCRGDACPATSGSGSLAATLATLAPGATVTFTLVGSVSPLAAGTLSNTATVAPPAGTTDGDAANDTATTTNALAAATADLGVTLTNAPSSVVAGSRYSYTVAATNAGPDVAANVVVTLSAPAGATVDFAADADAGLGWTCTAAAAVATCARPLLAPGEAAPVTIGLTAPATAGAASATATITSATVDPIVGNDTAVDTVDVLCAVDADCPSGERCAAGGACVPNEDAGPRDAGIDGGAADAAGSDGAGADAGRGDASPSDAAGAGDAAKGDASAQDAEAEDAAPNDGATGDAADGAPRDAASDGASEARDAALADAANAPDATDDAGDAGSADGAVVEESDAAAEADAANASSTDSGFLEGGGISCAAAPGPRRASGAAGLWLAVGLAACRFRRRRGRASTERSPRSVIRSRSGLRGGRGRSARCPRACSAVARRRSRASGDRRPPPPAKRVPTRGSAPRDRGSRGRDRGPPSR